ncbi:MAG: T9SS type A sorting domain-containing protein [Bacteroidetes bacterium]|nr:T9SS type A sorting domain-containing protein [Bacteroidota bacterium]
MSNAFRFVILALAMCLLGTAALAQTYDLQFVVITNDGTNYDVKVQVKANGSTFKMGTSNFFFNFNSSDLGFPTLLTPHNFSDGVVYQPMNVNGTGNSASVNIELNTAGSGTEVTTGYMDVATLRFAILDPAGNSNLVWDAGGSVVFKDDESTVVDAGTLNNLNTSPLPVQLSSFTAAMIQSSGGVLLKWTTLSETNNYGFEVQKSLEGSDSWQTIEGSFVAGNGTTLESHSYSYTDVSVTPGVWYYRLKQIDLDDAVHYSESIKPSGVTDVKEKEIPKEFALDQNYPNPFNPSTVINFALPRESKVSLEVYNLIGQRVAVLVNEVKPAGYHSLRFNGASFSSGIYFYSLVAGETKFLRKMVLVK